MTKTFRPRRPLGMVTRIGSVSLACVMLFGCDAPERLPADLSIENSKEVLRDKVIAPIKGVDEDELAIFEPLPRRKLLQVKHSPTSLNDRSFVSAIQTMLGEEATFESAVNGTEIEPMVPEPQELTDEQRQEILDQRSFERTKILVNKGLELEATLLEDMRTLDDRIETAMAQTVGGLGGNIPAFGRNLTQKQDGYLELPNDLIFVGGKNGTFSSKTALMRESLDNPVITFSVRGMPLPDAMDFLFKTVGLQAAMSDDVLASPILVSLSVEASTIAIMDALMEQHGLAIVYDPAIEVAQVYTQAQFDTRIQAIATSIRNYNSVLKAKQELAKAKSDHSRAGEILQYAQLLLGGDDQGFIRGIEGASRAPASAETSAMISDMTREALTLRADMIDFDEATEDMLSGDVQSVNASTGNAPIFGGVAANILSEDPCIWPKQEIFTEKMAIYNAIIIEGDDASSGIVGKINNFFTTTRPDVAGDNTTRPLADDIVIPAYCGTTNPAPKRPMILSDETGITVIGTREDNDLVLRLIEQYDVPELQVLIEIFIITVSRDFSRQIDSILSATDTAGGSGVNEATLSQVARTASTTAGTFNLGLSSPNSQLTNVINFLETNKLGRVVSSPTILVAAGKTASVKRDLIAKVPGPNVLNADNVSVPGPPVEYSAPFQLDIKEVDINRLNNTVKLDVVLTDTRFNTTLALVNELSDKTSDVIESVFWAAPGDVVVLAGLTRNEESTDTSGLPGTTNGLAPFAPLGGGADKFSTILSETLIFMAPTVIDPSSDNQPHSAFRTRNRRK